MAMGSTAWHEMPIMILCDLMLLKLTPQKLNGYRKSYRLNEGKYQTCIASYRENLQGRLCVNLRDLLFKDLIYQLVVPM